MFPFLPFSHLPAKISEKQFSNNVFVIPPHRGVHVANVAVYSHDKHANEHLLGIKTERLTKPKRKERDEAVKRIEEGRVTFLHKNVGGIGVRMFLGRHDRIILNIYSPYFYRFFELNKKEVQAVLAAMLPFVPTGRSKILKIYEKPRTKVTFKRVISIPIVTRKIGEIIWEDYIEKKRRRLARIKRSLHTSK